MRIRSLLLISLALSGCATNAENPPNQHVAVIDTELMALDLQNHDPQAARMHLAEAQSLAPDDPQVLVAQGYFAESMDDVADASKAYAAAIAKAPNDPQIVNDYGTFLYHQSDYVQALPYFERAAANPDNAISAEAYENAGLTANKLNKSKQAQIYFAHAIAENPDYGI